MKLRKNSGSNVSNRKNKEEYSNRKSKFNKFITEHEYKKITWSVYNLTP